MKRYDPSRGLVTGGITVLLIAVAVILLAVLTTGVTYQ